MMDKTRAESVYVPEMPIMWSCPECGTVHGVQNVDPERFETRTQCFNCYHPFKVTFDGVDLE